ncbi:hypothetical protein [Parafrankia soli]|uniref:hypothetical protein n=1 Tax=Parafrankia soli TaxID=2599596 RepID=UPI001F51B0FD|nr:hypothetical protein [Parafrankia soli]
MLRLAVLAPTLLAGATIAGSGAEALPVPGALIEDTSIGSGVSQVSYFGDWSACTRCGPATPNNSYRESVQPSSGAVLRFSGTQVDVYGVLGPSGGIATISVDGGTPTAVDTYAAAGTVSRIYQSGLLNPGIHTAVIVNIGWRNPASSGVRVAFDPVPADRAVLSVHQQRLRPALHRSVEQPLELTGDGAGPPGRP